MSRNDIAKIVLLMPCVFFLCGFNFLSVFKNEEGNKYYKKGQVGKAKSAYQSALKTDPKSPEIAFNLGNAYYREESFKDSLGVYKNAAESSEDPLLQSKAFYNLGNTLYRNQDAEKAVQFYKQALRIDPKDQDAKYNLELLTKKSKQDQKKAQDKQKNKQDQKQDQNNKQDQGGGQGQPQDQKDQKDDQSQGGGSGDQNKEGQEQKDQGQKDQEDQQSKSGQSPEEKQAENQDQKGGDGQDKEEDKGEQDQNEEKSEDKQSEGAGQGEEQKPKPTEAQLRAEQILEALGNQEQKIMKMGGNDKKVKRIQRYVDKDW